MRDLCNSCKFLYNTFDKDILRVEEVHSSENKGSRISSVLKHAEFSLGDFTIICGENNTGKTYVTYALYGFLDLWRRRFDDARHIPSQYIR